MHYNDSLVVRYQQTKDPDVLTRVLAEYDLLLRKIARKYSRAANDITFDDLYSVAYLAFMKALEKYDPTRNTRFSTVLTWYLNGDILHYVRDNGSLISIPAYIQERAYTAQKTLKSIGYTEELPSASTMANLSGLPKEKCKELLSAYKHTRKIGCVSLESEEGQDFLEVHGVDEDFSLIDFKSIAEEIIRKYDSGDSSLSLSRQYEISVENVQKLVKNRALLNLL